MVASPDCLLSTSAHRRSTSSPYLCATWRSALQVETVEAPTKAESAPSSSSNEAEVYIGFAKGDTAPRCAPLIHEALVALTADLLLFERAAALLHIPARHPEVPPGTATIS